MVIGVSANSQNPEVLQEKLKTELPAIERVETILTLSNILSYSYPDSALRLAEEAIELSKTNIEINDYLSKALRVKAGIMWVKGELLEGIEIAKRSIQLAELNNDFITVGGNYLVLGNIYDDGGSIKASRDYTWQALNSFLKADNQRMIFASLNNLGRSFMQEGELDSARRYFDMAKANYRDEFNSMLPIFNFNLGELEFESGNYELADSILLEVNKVSELAGDLRAMARTHQLQAHIFLLNGDSETALKKANHAMKLAEDVGTNRLQQITSSTLSEVHAYLGNYEEAYWYKNLSLQHDDSLRNVKVKNQLELLTYADQQHQLELLETENELNELRAESRRNLNITLVIISISLIVFLTLLIQNRSKIKRQKNALQDLDDIKHKIFGVVAHDLRSPIQNLFQLAQEVVSDPSADEVLRKHGQDVVTRGRSVIDLMDNLLHWAKSTLKGTEQSISEFKPASVVEEVIERLENQIGQKNLSIVNEVSAKRSVLGDRKVFMIVFRNLVVNAIKYSRDGGKITINDREENSYYEVAVLDEGIGMNEKQIDDLFTYQVNSTQGTHGESGSGLGLTLCKEFLDLIGGRIDAKSKLGKGTTFYFSLPIPPK